MRREPSSPELIAAISLVSLFFNADYRPGVVGVAIWFVLAVLYFAVSGRHKLILSPEEEFAMTGGEHGAHLETEGYGQTHVSDITKPRRPRTETRPDKAPHPQR